MEYGKFNVKKFLYHLKKYLKCPVSQVLLCKILNSLDLKCRNLSKTEEIQPNREWVKVKRKDGNRERMNKNKNKNKQEIIISSRGQTVRFWLGRKTKTKTEREKEREREK